MPVPDIPSSLPENAPFFEQIGYGIAVGVVALGWVIRQIFKGREEKKDEPPKPFIMERAELADMEPVRRLVAQMPEILKRLDELKEMSADVEETRRASEVMRQQLEKIARKSEVDEEVERRLREEERHRQRRRTE